MHKRRRVITGLRNTEEKKGVALYHVVYESETCTDAASALFDLLRKTADKYPGQARHLVIDIDGHVDAHGHYDQGMYDLQQHFCLEYLFPYCTSVWVPVRNCRIYNPVQQRDDIPDRLDIGNGTGDAS